MTPSSLLRPVAAFAVATAVAVGAAGCGSSSSSSSGGADPAAAVPATAPVYLEAVLQPKGDQKANAEAILGKLLNTADPKAKIAQLLDAQKGRTRGILFSRDIEPWIGQRAGVAITSVSAATTAAGGPTDATKALVVIDTTDAGKAQAALDKDAKGVKRSYRGVDYRVDDDTARAVVGDEVLLGDEAALKASLDVLKGNAKSLADAASYKKVRDTVGTDGVGAMYVDLNSFIQSVATTSGTSAATGIQALKGVAGGALSAQLGAEITASPNAIRIDGAVLNNVKTAATGAGNGPAAVADAPAGVLLAAGVGNVGARAQAAITQFSQAGALGGIDPATLFSQLRSQFGVDIQQDLLSWMGDAAVWVGGTSLSDLQVAAVISSKDPAKSTAAVAKIGKLLAALGQTSTPLTVAGGTGLSVSVGGLGAEIDVAAEGDKFVIAYGKGAVEAALNPTSKLGDSQPYKAVAAELDGTKPSFYVDTAALLGFAAPLLGGQGGGLTAAQPTLAHLGSIAFGGASSGDTARLKGAIVIK